MEECMLDGLKEESMEGRVDNVSMIEWKKGKVVVERKDG